MAERGNIRIDRHGTHIMTHHPLHCQVTYPANIMGRTNGLSAQMKTPGGKGISESFSYEKRRGYNSAKNQHGDWKVARDFERKESHGHWPAHDRHCHRTHANHGIDFRR